MHEVLPVTAGCRLVLVYNLLRRGPGRLPEVPDYDDEQTVLTAVLTRWVEALRRPEPTEPLKLIYTLEHAFTQAELGFGSLKGADAALAPLVVEAAMRAGCEFHLALISIRENGSAEQIGGHSRYARDEDDGAFEIVEMNDRSATVSHWRRPDGEPSPLTELPIEEEEFAPPVSFDDLEPDEEHFEEATGNAGASYERTYSRTALVLWPSDQILEVINQGGLAATLPFLEDLVDRWNATGDTAIRGRAHELSAHIISGWSMEHWYPNHDEGRSGTGEFLNQLVRLEAPTRIEQFLTDLTTRGGFDIGDTADIAAALHSLSPQRSGVLADTLIASAVTSALAASARLLARFAAVNPVVATTAARTMVASLPGDPAREKDARVWRRGPGVRPAFIVDLLTALGRIDSALAETAINHVLHWPHTYDFDRILLPAVHTLLDAPETTGQPAAQRLRAACLTHLDTRIALPLEPPGDWQRNNALGCKCADCRLLGEFLADATKPVWVFPAAQPRRSHVESSIANSKPDVDVATQRRGSPHRLICTKNQASYQRRSEQRRNDLIERVLLKQ